MIEVYFLGQCHENGIGVEKDLDKAVRLYTKAAELGHESAKKALQQTQETIQ